MQKEKRDRSASLETRGLRLRFTVSCHGQPIVFEHYGLRLSCIPRCVVHACCLSTSSCHEVLCQVLHVSIRYSSSPCGCCGAHLCTLSRNVCVCADIDRFGRTPLPLPEPARTRVPLFKLIQFQSAANTTFMVYTAQVHPYCLSDGGMECTTRFEFHLLKSFRNTNVSQ